MIDSDLELATLRNGFINCLNQLWFRVSTVGYKDPKGVFSKPFEIFVLEERNNLIRIYEGMVVG